MTFFYFETIKKYIIAFASLFDELYVQRWDETKQQFEQIKVPISFSPKTKVYQYLKTQRHDIATYLPRIGFELVDIQFDSERKKQTNIILGKDTTQDKILLEGVPYIFNFNMVIWTKFYEDNLQLLEQIVSQFSPDVSLSIKQNILFQFEKTIIIQLAGVNFNINTDLSAEDIQIIQSSLDFSIKGYIYPNIMNANLIKQIDLTGYYQDQKRTNQLFQKLIQ